MFNKSSGKFSKRKGSVYLLIFLLPLLFFLISIFLNNGIQNYGRTITRSLEKVDLYELWEEKQYEDIVLYCENALDDDFLNFNYLRFHGFANFYLGISQVSLEMKIPHINEAIKSLRKAFVLADDSIKKNIAVVLGKAYYFKGASYKGAQYSDLSIKYLNIAQEYGYSGKDIYEFKGLAYYELGLYDQCIEELGLLPKEKHTPDIKYRISKAYKMLDQEDKQEEILLEILENSVERDVKLDTYLDLADIYFRRSDYGKSIEFANEVLKGRADDIDAQLIVAKSLDLSGKIIESKKLFRKILKLKPGDKEIISWINR